jgi:hypothetical protein
MAARSGSRIIAPTALRPTYATENSAANEGQICQLKGYDGRRSMQPIARSHTQRPKHHLAVAQAAPNKSPLGYIYGPIAAINSMPLMRTLTIVACRTAWPNG